jgi:feruloyl esterase
MNHCGGGEGATQWDPLTAIEQWDATGQPPVRIVATRGGPAGPGAPQLPPISRPLCPYPLIARYNGSGSQDDAANFTCAAAPK